MSLISFPGLNSEGDIKQLIDRLEAFAKDFNFTMSGNLSSENAREFGGWRIGKTDMRSKDGDVGMSTADTAADDIRFWAGDGLTATPPWLVRKSGKMVATSGGIGGWEIGTDSLKDTSGKVGLSSTVTAGDDVRFFAGSTNINTAPYRVYESGAVSASNIAITGGSISVATDVYVGSKIYMNPSSFTSDIVFSSGIKAYGDPAAGALHLSAPGGVYANGIRIDVTPPPPGP
ncbi:hypothetical protein AB4Z22_00125 [Paenibacillus sp. TAF58]